jgi:hypothetical protein
VANFAKMNGEGDVDEVIDSDEHERRRPPPSFGVAKFKKKRFRKILENCLPYFLHFFEHHFIYFCFSLHNLKLTEN